MKDAAYTSAEVSSYLRRRRTGRNSEPILEIEDFLKDVSTLFALRMAAEETWTGSPRGSAFDFLEHRHQANSLQGALPLEWDVVNSIILPSEDGPRSTLITYIATRCIEDVKIISSGLRRVLSRERVSTPIGKVQQLDNYCMRWLMRQPGRDFAEKGGALQRVMAVVRREQFDTLENRVFKDFLIRAENLAEGYLKENEKRFKSYKIYESVRRFYLACKGALILPEMDNISGINKLPQPNYVLQQDNRYSKIWNAYCKVIKLSTLAEKLWNHRADLKSKLQALGTESSWQKANHEVVLYHSQVWMNPLDGRAEFTEKTKSHHAVITDSIRQSRSFEKLHPFVSNGVAVVDLSGAHTWGDTLVYGGFHPNARPRIRKDNFPIVDDEFREAGCKKQKLSSFLNDVTDAKRQDEGGEEFKKAIKCISDYSARLWGEYKAQVRIPPNELVVLSPDDWNAVTQELIIRSFPMLERASIHLLWRSIATVLGMNEVIVARIKENDCVAVIDFRSDGSVLVTGLNYLMDEESGRLVPQRSVFSKNGSLNTERYSIFETAEPRDIFSSDVIRKSKIVCLDGLVPTSVKAYLKSQWTYSVEESDDEIEIGRCHGVQVNWIVITDREMGWHQRSGALLFSAEHEHRTLYFDELEPMYVVGQDEQHEVVKAVEIVHAVDKFKGGTSAQYDVPVGLLNIGEGQRNVRFLFHLGQITDTTPLHRYNQDLLGDVVRHSVALDVKVEVSPGQGIALTRVSSPVFKEPILLDYLNNMELSTETIAEWNNRMKRSFPPISAIVEAYQTSFQTTFWGPSFSDNDERIKRFAEGRIAFKDIPSDLFYHAQRKKPQDLKHGESNLHLLDRFNVFGNVAYALRPCWMTEETENHLIRKIMSCMRSDEAKALKLLAWTYRGDHPVVVELTRKIFKRWAAGMSPGYAGGLKLWRSLLSNMLPCRSLCDLLPSFILEFSRRGVENCLNGDDLRLFYNIVQFDEAFCAHSGLDCRTGVTIALALGRCIKKYRENLNPTNFASALRCLLYLLRLREKDKHFLRDYSRFQGEIPESAKTIERMDTAFHLLNRELSAEYPQENNATHMLRIVVKDFLNGAGTLPGFINIDSNGNTLD